MHLPKHQSNILASYLTGTHRSGLLCNSWVGLVAYLWATIPSLNTLFSSDHVPFSTPAAPVCSNPGSPNPCFNADGSKYICCAGSCPATPGQDPYCAGGAPGLSPEAKLEALGINAVNRNGPYIGIVVPNPYEIVVSRLWPSLLVSRPGGWTQKPALQSCYISGPS